jgi:predicted secreted protein
MATLGNKRKFYVGTSSSGEWKWLAGEQSNSFNLNAEMIDVSDKSSEWQQFISGIKGATAEVTVFSNSDSQQQQFMNALIAGTSVHCFVGELSGNDATSGYIFEALVSSIGETNDNGAVSSRSISLQVTGEVEPV